MRPTAIVVDDHPSFRKMARRLLTAAGYDVVGEAADAAGAVTAASECHPAFVLLDVLLPDGSGLDVADLIGGPGAPVVLLVSSRAAAAFTFFASLYSSRMSRLHLADLLARLAGAEPGTVQSLLSGLLHDPQLRLGLWGRDRGAYLDTAGGVLDVG